MANYCLKVRKPENEPILTYDKEKYIISDCKTDYNI